MPIKTTEKKVSTSPTVEGFVNAFYRGLKKNEHEDMITSDKQHRTDIYSYFNLHLK